MASGGRLAIKVYAFRSVEQEFHSCAGTISNCPPSKSQAARQALALMDVKVRSSKNGAHTWQVQEITLLKQFGPKEFSTNSVDTRMGFLR